MRFTSGARTNGQSHANGQLLDCTDGAGLVASRDGTVLALQAGESVWTPPGEEHWHGGRADQMTCHYAILDETETGDATGVARAGHRRAVRRRRRHRGAVSLGRRT